MSLDKLDDLFALQTKLNDHIFRKRQLRGLSGSVLSTQDLFAQAREQPVAAHSDTTHWLSNYRKALEDESRELGEELPWKWWSKESVDMDAVRVEIVDMLHFWISLALVSGMDADEVLRLYKLKNEVNLARQETEYSASQKTERDDTHIR